MISTTNEIEVVEHKSISKDELAKYGIYLLSIFDLFENAFENIIDDEDTLFILPGDFITIIVDKDSDEVIGFTSTEYGSPRELIDLYPQPGKVNGIKTIIQRSLLPKKEGLYLKAAAVSKESWGKGIFKKMMKRRIDQAIKENIGMIFLETQNPKVEAAILSLLESKKKSRKIKGYRVRRRKIVNHYDVMMSNSKPKLDDSKTGKAFSELDFENGDGYLLYFHIRHNN